jgi:hypothetical protein
MELSPMETLEKLIDEQETSSLKLEYTPPFLFLNVDFEDWNYLTKDQYLFFIMPLYEGVYYDLYKSTDMYFDFIQKISLHGTKNIRDYYKSKGHLKRDNTRDV